MSIKKVGAPVKIEKVASNREDLKQVKDKKNNEKEEKK